MDAPSSCLKKSAQTKTVKEVQPEADRILWQDFIRSPGITEWIAEIIIRKRGGDLKPETVAFFLNHAWYNMAMSKGYRIGKGDAKTYAIRIIQQSLLRPYGRKKLIDTITVRLDDPEVQKDEASLRDRKCDNRSEQSVLVEAAQKTISHIDGDARQWADTFMNEVKKPQNKEKGENGRMDRERPIGSTEDSLGWTRHRCEQARKNLQIQLGQFQDLIRFEPRDEEPKQTPEPSPEELAEREEDVADEMEFDYELSVCA